MALQTATFGAGCFWCLEAAMNQLNGVISALSGYMGGSAETANYRRVCDGDTGHAEVVQVEYDDTAISYEQLCLIFFSLHDPTQLNRQGNDIGTQYRSAIFFHNDKQQHIANNIIAELKAENVFSGSIVTEVSPVTAFYIAEEYHQGYFLKHPEQGYCQVIVAPKMMKFRQHYQALLKS
ncbi:MULTISPECIES: peptide-methionine (S)-S-oxide reductase MsrA [Rheinheimera]|uniref:Peptide methionine sulfoxide reductase MsrA n=1 Tax=Rheinheimera aquimaris TaxID=412437 RepID=A0ABN1DXE7_9GAMM|nr:MULTISPECIES: peptide-methionine (S)-S-oxide reductase MsrA [Rheinheimera]MCB5213772.1 peptide-methionine (S)-S-oxide reductase MsrA [Rheinheimera aquimaris]MCD1598046.1 peptide-methionine (S)-S-oxide reductase MsrA [Rheinheimera aquimaris]